MPVFNPAAGGQPVHFDARDYGNIYAADAAPAIQAAIDAASAAGGGRVHLPHGTFTCGSLRLKSRVVVAGSGKGTRLVLKAAANVAFIVLDTVNTEMVGLESLRVDGNASQQTGGDVSHGVIIDNTAGVYTYSDPYHTFREVFVENVAGSAWVVTSGVREARFTNCHAKSATVRGFDVAGTDNFFGFCTSATTGRAGFYISNGNNHFDGCKAFSAGYRIATSGDEAEGLRVQNSARNVFVTFSAQDCHGTGILVNGTGAQRNTFASSLSDSNGVSAVSTFPGWRFDNCSQNNLAACQSGNQRGTQDVGLDLKATATDNTIEMYVSGHATPITATTTTAAASNAVRLNSNAGVQSLAYAASVTPDPYKGGTVLMTLTGNLTINAPSNPYAGQRLQFVFTQDATGGRTVTFAAAFKTAWTPTTTANARNVIEFVHDGANWLQTSAQTGLPA